jgi:hypothetical protein
VSVRDPAEPTLAAFGVEKDDDEFGIDTDDGLEGSQLPYDGPEVRPLGISVRRGSRSGACWTSTRRRCGTGSSGRRSTPATGRG